MSNLANYSPYNKTFKFILFQNQAYHEKNKRTAKPCVRSNLRYSKSAQQSRQSSQNPEYPRLLKNLSQSESYQQCLSPTYTNKANSVIFSQYSENKNMSQSAIFDKEKRVVHKNKSFEKFRTKAIVRENMELVDRLMESSSPQAIINENSKKSYSRHLKYRQIRKKYNDNGHRKHALALGKQQLLCPTLSEFNNSGLGPKFLHNDLSMYTVTKSLAGTSRLNSPRKSQISTPIQLNLN